MSESRKIIYKKHMEKFYIVCFAFFLFAGQHYLFKYLDPELNDNAFVFDGSIVTNNEAIVHIQSQKRYLQTRNIMHPYKYYVFTDKGRLIIKRKSGILEETLYNRIENSYLNKYCIVRIFKPLIKTDWRLNYIKDSECNKELSVVQQTYYKTRIIKKNTVKTLLN